MTVAESAPQTDMQSAGISCTTVDNNSTDTERCAGLLAIAELLFRAAVDKISTNRLSRGHSVIALLVVKPPSAVMCDFSRVRSQESKSSHSLCEMKTGYVLRKFTLCSLLLLKFSTICRVAYLTFGVSCSCFMTENAVKKF